MFFIIEEVKETILDFSQGTVSVLSFYFVFNITKLYNNKFYYVK